MKAVAAALLVAIAAASGCGGPAPDLFVVERSGSTPDAKLTLKVTDDGFVACKGGALKQLTSHQLLVARAIARDLQQPASKHVSLPAREGSIMRYRVLIEDGDDVSFSDNSRNQPEVFYRAAVFTRDVAMNLCGLAR